MELITIIIIGLSLSIDAFALSTLYGIINYSNQKICLVSITIGIFHFIMPILGYFLSKYISLYITIDDKYVFLIVLIMILLEMIKSLKEKDKKDYELNIINIILFAFLVSIDSFSLGLGIHYITNNILLASSVFALLSSLFTFFGFKIGKYISIKLRNISKYVGICILFTIIIYILCKV